MSKNKVVAVLIIGAIIFHSYAVDNSYQRGYEEGYDKGYSVASKEYTTVLEETYMDGYYNRVNSNVSGTVYVTDSGTKYHKPNCSYLKSKRAVTLSDALALGYDACSRCY
jgi:uncharacterized membrane protein YfhO